MPKSLAFFYTLTLVCAAHGGAAKVTDDGTEFFERQVRPILVQRCYECHSAGKKVKGGLALDTAEGVSKGGELGAVVRPGQPNESLLIKAVRYADQDLQMPPKHRLESNEVAVLERWVAIGAPYPPNVIRVPGRASEHWAFQPVRTHAVPRTANARWAANDIDRFIVGRLEERGIQPGPAADRRTLIRRATFDLIGLPPTREEVDAFVNDRAPGAFERVVDRLLSSPHYGERWGRHWLDLVHYADTAGDSADYPVPQAYRYRNYVIESFNQDKPYDRFLREQVAGDLLPATSAEEKQALIIATGFIASARRFSVEPASAMHLTIEDTLDTIGKSVLGLSLSCARCHDHKFDPISMRDYYALYGIFSSTRYPYPGSEEKKRQSDFVHLLSDTEWQARHKLESDERARLDTEVSRLEKRIDLMKKEGLDDRELRRELRPIRQKRDDLVASLSLADMAYAVTEGSPANAKIHLRGEPHRFGDEIARGFPTALGGQRVPKEERGSGRLQLAEWLSEPANPLTARVMVNRIWQHHFGKGLVQTASDFGTRGRPPTHPELLDYLAGRFMAHGWSLKTMHKLIMLSQTYQQTSSDDPAKALVDPSNELLWKQNRQRLDAESLRDAILAISENMECTNAGQHPFPLPNRWDYTQHSQFTALYETHQRSVYLMQQRIRKHPFMAIFDGADPNSSTAQRPVTTTPLQALFALNDKFVHEQAQHFAQRLLAKDCSEAARITRACELAYGRPASLDEIRTGQNYLRELVRKLQKSRVADSEGEAWASFARALFGSNEFMFVD
jgi:hypothetical protein